MRRGLLLHALFLLILAASLASGGSPAYAGCPGLGAPGSIATALTGVLYDPVAGVMKACVGDNWVSLGTGGGGGASALSGLSDVSVTGIGDGKSLVYNGTSSKWEPQTITGGAISGLSDVDTTGIADGKSLVYNATSSKWVPMAVSSSASTLAALTDVSTTGIADGKTLVYNATSSKWIPMTVSSGATTLAALTDISTTGIADGKALVYNATTTKWEPETISSGSSTVSGTTGTIAKFTGATAVGDSIITESSGKIGIGTTSPSNLLTLVDTSVAPLHVESNNTIVTGIELENTSASGRQWALYSTGSGATEGAGKFLIKDTANAVRMTVDTGGNFGIGTASPDAKLHVEGTHARIQVKDPEGEIAYMEALSANDNVRIGSASNHPVAFSVNNTERMYLTTAGNVSIGTTTPGGGKLTVNGWISPTSDGSVATDTNALAGISWHPTANATDYAIYRTPGAWTAPNYQQLRLGFVTGIVIDGGSGYAKSGTVLQPNGGNVGIGTTTPNYKLEVQGSVAGVGAYNALSDARLKTDIAGSGYGLSVVERLRPVTYYWKAPADEMLSGRQLGFIAQEVEPIVPEAVTTGKDAMGTKRLAYETLIPVLTKAIQELKAANDNLAREHQRDIGELRQEIDALKSDRQDGGM